MIELVNTFNGIVENTVFNISAQNFTGGASFTIPLDDTSFTPVNLFQQKLDAGFSVVPLQFWIFNSAAVKFSGCQFTNGVDFWNSQIDFAPGKYSILAPLEVAKGNHIHINSLTISLVLTGTAPLIPGNLFINVIYSYYK